MISLRIREQWGIDWTECSFEGEDEEVVAMTLVSRLVNAENEVLISRDGGEFISFSEDGEEE